MSNKTELLEAIRKSELTAADLTEMAEDEKGESEIGKEAVAQRGW